MANTSSCIHQKTDLGKTSSEAIYPDSVYSKLTKLFMSQRTVEQYSHVWCTDLPRDMKLTNRNCPNNEYVSHKMRHAFRLFYDILEEFTLNSSLHGFRYLLDKKYTRIERLCWLVIVVCSVISCSYFIGEILEDNSEEPIDLHYAEISSSAWKIPFPAVTICSESKVRQRIFNYSKAYMERWSDPPTINQDNFNLYHDALLVCDNEFSDGSDYANANSLDTLQRLAPTLEQMFFYCLWGNFTCDQLFYKTLTKEGYCYTFNMLSAEELFRMENLHQDYYHTYGPNRSTSWTFENGYADGAPVHAYPLRGLSYTGDEFEVILLTNLLDLDPVCRGPIQGFKISLHNPAELPYIGQNYFPLPVTYQLTAALKPQLTFTPESIRKYPPSQRKCYFPDERYLRYFQTYTERNCDLECSANLTVKQCGCVPPYMPHDPSTKVCGGGKAKCISKTLEWLSLQKSVLGEDANEQSLDCGCLQSCLEIEYDADISNAVFDLRIFAQNNPDIPLERPLPSGLILYFGEEQFTSIHRSDLDTFEEILGHCGAFLGLFLGFSFLSLAEIVFFLTLRLWSKLHNRVKPEEDRQPHPFPWVW